MPKDKIRENTLFVMGVKTLVTPNMIAQTSKEVIPKIITRKQ